MLGYGVLNKIGNFLLLIALAHLPASVQYPMVTGGVMICSTVICFFTHQKPGKREIASLVLSFVGILALVLL
jgi:multidrug transporter EmrE-like cation transporter